MTSLHHTVLRAEGGAPTRHVLVLHGILGMGNNLRALGQAFVREHPSIACVLVDLRMHGRSQGFEPPHDIDACAADLCALESALSLPVSGVFGHSFGGKVALAYAAQRPALDHIALLDSGPFARPDRRGSEHTMAVLDMLDALPERFESRAAFIAEWLAMNLERSDTGYRFRLDVSAIRALLDDYFARDLWRVLATHEARIDVVIGRQSNIWDTTERERLTELAQRRARLRIHELDAGHWVHVDDPSGLLGALSAP
jgi:pimeloyl-ACP methyl ester carboxylesterase